MTKIEWTEKTWNPIVGCSIVSPGCTNCYAMKMAARLDSMAGDGLDDNGYGVRGAGPLDHYHRLTKRSKAGPVWSGKLALAPEHILTVPLRRKKPTTYFVNSMGDLFHEDVPDEWIDRAFAVMAICDRHTFQILTKRSSRMKVYLSDPDMPKRVAAEAGSTMADGDTWLSVLSKQRWPLHNVWLGVSAERQIEADERIPDLLATPAAVRFVSAEPLLGPIDFTQGIYHDAVGISMRGYLKNRDESDDFHFHAPKLDWIIAGGESGPGARPMHPDWALSIRDQCAASGTPFFFKQWGEYEPTVSAEDFAEYVSGEADNDDIRDAAARCKIVWPSGHVQNPQRDRSWWDCQEFSDADSDTSGMTKCPVMMRRVGKRTSGRLLDGREHNDMPVQVGDLAQRHKVPA